MNDLKKQANLWILLIILLTIGFLIFYIVSDTINNMKESKDIDISKFNISKVIYNNTEIKEPKKLLLRDCKELDHLTKASTNYISMKFEKGLINISILKDKTIIDIGNTKEIETFKCQKVF